MDQKVNAYFEKKSIWTDELIHLRNILTRLPLEETIKWGAPTYTYKGKNVVGLAGFKNYFGLWFFQGALIDDKFKVFINAQEGKTKAMLQWRFTSKEEIDSEKISDYVHQAIENVEKGIEIKPQKSTSKIVIPELLSKTIEGQIELGENFHSLSKSKQREYCEYIQQAKRESTKQKRLEKIIPMILRGVGLNDQYKK
ncbi:MAG: hypothetical protein CMB99_14625 [Flavobacteriaceae bacterium]|nr:hypothetical protein [Flavobacteriaceae bacterium]|tara:strand:+ start:219512 stop:220102 length:591 start_codon:yes stop_codon:yes gene_type:complete